MYSIILFIPPTLSVLYYSPSHSRLLHFPILEKKETIHQGSTIKLISEAEKFSALRRLNSISRKKEKETSPHI
jgi:hypothetical protein